MLNPSEETLLLSLQSQRRIEGARYGMQSEIADKNPGMKHVAMVTKEVCNELDKQIGELIEKKNKK